MTRRIVTAREQAQMLSPWHEAATVYHRQERADSPFSGYVYTADDPYSVGHETRGYGDHITYGEVPDDALTEDPYQPRRSTQGERWHRIDKDHGSAFRPYTARRSMTAAVTLFTKPSCPQCVMTKKQLDAHGIPHDVVDVTTDPQAHEFVTGLGYKQAPVVHAGDDNHWSGFRPDRIRGLTG